MKDEKKIYAIDPDFYSTNRYEESPNHGRFGIFIKLFLVVFLVGMILWGYNYMKSKDSFNQKEVSMATVEPVFQKDSRLTTKHVMKSEDIEKIVKTVLMQMHSQAKNPREVEDNIYANKKVDEPLKSDELSREYVESVQNELGK